ncbi:MAG: Na/Pi symporter [Candidatus Thiodiazotropha sp.]|nr:Na/Pi symporter [Candidatus Thiodiazotropha sp.]MCM8884788.1 Na/Pi symporter [Candidatus Thiodiazotropha sp.]MCM8921632.1 Na/Pi symporter [Candidatus Thiodiazotropha sp.]
MIRKILLPSILLILTYGFWISPDFKEIAAGVAIFLFGMLSLEEGFKAFTGGTLERILRNSTNRYWKSLSFGIVSTTVMQSSSLVSVITISFLSAGLISLAAGIGIIFGANIGTTTGAWLIAGLGLKVKISAYAMPMLVFGVILLFQKSNTYKGFGYILAGLGFLFLGIHHMKEGFEAFKSTIDLTEFAVAGYPGLFLFAGIGIFATVVMQSSHATLVLILTGLAAGQVTYENALALAIGANVGTCITAILGALSANVEGKRLAGAHLIFNVTTGVIAILFIKQFLWGVEGISALVGIADDDYTLKLAVFHTLFNITGVLVMSPLIGKLVTTLENMLRAKEVSVVEPKYLSDATMEFPDTAMESVRKETLHLYDNALEIIAHGVSLHRHDIFSKTDLAAMIQQPHKVIDIDIDEIYGRNVKVLYGSIIGYISEAQTQITSDYSEDLYSLRLAGRYIVEALKDVKHLRKNLATYMVSDNEHIRAEYNKFRLQIGNILRELGDLREQSEDPNNITILNLDALKAEIEEIDVVANGSLDHLIRENLITEEMATSIMNDSAYTFDISKNLIDMAEILFAARALDLREAERDIALNEEELEEIIEEVEAEEKSRAK